MSETEPEPLSSLRKDLMGIIRERGLVHFDEPVGLASGGFSRDFIDTKRALARGSDLRKACVAVIELVDQMGVQFGAIGGLTMGADKVAHGVSVVIDGDIEWFSVRKQAKERGTRKRIEGAELGPGMEVLLVEDVVTRGGSIADALQAIRETGATVVAAVSIVDRGELGRRLFEHERIPYQPLFTFADLMIEPVRDGPGVAATS
ncbi:MAG TPA: phosphoribosyltransferase family protein [Acidimicrobiales bacterium]|nr:phosphoribosyltransferase family protein [Acidimicrobiales bacterium]